MKVETVWEVRESKCDICGHEWVAVIETDQIDWGTHKEVNIVQELECPNCKNK